MSGSAALDRLNDALTERLGEIGIACERRLHSVALDGTDVAFAVTAVWENPQPRMEGRLRLGGVEIAIRSPTLFPDTVYEYAYGSGADDRDGQEAALGNWIANDLPVLRQAATGLDLGCSLREMRRNSANGIAPGTWRIVCGPLLYMAGAQPCCNDCLFAASLPSLLPFMARPVSFAVKLVATKGDDGATSADCRRNGEDVPEGIAAIAEAATHWPTLRGLQMRRQYLYFQAPPPMDA